MHRKFGIKYLLAVFLVGGIFLFATQTFAQGVSDIYVNTIPSNPAPGEEVIVSLGSYLVNLDSVPITWYENTKKAASGVGVKSYTTVAPSADKETSIVAEINTPEGKVSVTATIRPSIMVILWETDDSYVPPFYKGKALLTADSSVKIVAMPEVKQGSAMVNPKNMVYSWRKDYSNDQEASGYGKNYFTYTSDYLDPSSFIEVSATTVAGDKTSSGGANINTYQPKVLFYRIDEVLGTLFENTLKNGHKISDKEVVFAAPYFISPRNINSPLLNWFWYINDSMVTIEGPWKNIVPLQVESGVSGVSKLRLLVENKYKLTQTASGEVQFEF